MDKKIDVKLKLLYILKFLEEKSDENNPISSAEIIDMLNEVGIRCERKTVYKDIAALSSFGYDVIKTKTPKSGWFLGERIFEIPELCLLIDAVQSASFITSDKTNVLIDKLKSLTSESFADKIQNRVYVDKRIKCTNQEIYYTIDKLHTAINEKKKVEFLYEKKAIQNEGITIDKHTLKMSPYAMVWNDNKYYLVGNNEKYDNLMHARIDKIFKLKILDEPIRHFSEVSEYKTEFDTADYALKVFSMFSGEVKDIELICNNKLLDNITDRFGENIKIYKHDADSFRVEFRAAMSAGLISWISQYRSAVKIVAPEQLKTMYINELKEILALYDE